VRNKSRAGSSPAFSTKENILKNILNILIVLSFLHSNSIQDIEDLFYDGKLLDAKSLIEKFENHDEKSYYLGYEIYMKLDDLNNANKYLQSAMNLNSVKYANEGERLGKLINDLKNVNKTLTSGFVDEAIEESIILVNKYENNSICYHRLGYAYKQNEDYDNAIINFSKAKELNPFNNLYHEEITKISNIELLKGKEYYDMEDYQTALTHFNKALEYDPDNAYAMFRIGNIYYAIKDFVKASDIYEKGLKRKKNYKVYNLLGKCYVALDEYDKALKVFDKALEINDTFTNAMFEKAKVYKALNQIDTSIEMLNRIINIDSSYSKAYELLIDIEISRNNLDQAIIYGNSGISIFPDSYTLLHRLASVYNQKEMFVKGRDYAKNSLKYKKNYAPSLFELGISEMNLCNKLAAKDAFTKCKRDRNYRRSANDYLKPENFDYYTKHCN
tara:strand:+ start:1291 stop:2622 length:1332 start_codon:yes stop_codon:yes gene_type:complete